MTNAEKLEREGLLDRGLLKCRRSSCRFRGEAQPVTEFGADRRSATGYDGYCKTCRTELRRTPGAMAARKRHRRSLKYRQNQLTRAKRTKANTPKQLLRARWTVQNAINLGHIPRARVFQCSICAQSQARDYHHHRGYDEAHMLDVIPVCRQCHLVVDKNPAIQRRVSKIQRKHWKPLVATHCKRGHPFTPQNTGRSRRASGEGYRYCKQCHRQRAREFRARH